jgi:hypothetical protein
MLLTVEKCTEKTKSGKGTFHIKLVGTVKTATKVPEVTLERKKSYYLTNVKEPLAIGSQHEFSNEDWVVSPIDTEMEIDGVMTEMTLNYLITKEQAQEQFSRV